jgi:hypothetical protein
METGDGQRWELSEGDRPRTGCRFRDRCPVFRAKGEPALCVEKDSEPCLRELTTGRQVACHFPLGS